MEMLHEWKSFCIVSFCLLSFVEHCLRVICATNSYIYLLIYGPHFMSILIINSFFVGDHLAYFQFLVIISNSALNILVHIYLCTHIEFL